MGVYEPERLWANGEALLLRTADGYMLVCTAGRSALLTVPEARRLAIALGESGFVPPHQPAETVATPATAIRTPVPRKKPKSRKAPKRPARTTPPPSVPIEFVVT